MDIDELVFYSNSLHSINLIKGPPMKYHVHVVLIQDIKELIEQSNITIYYTLHEGNQCLDFKASQYNYLSAKPFSHTMPYLVADPIFF